MVSFIVSHGIESVTSECRYTASKDGQSVYACLLVWPNSTSEISLGAPVTSASTTVSLLGSSGGPLNWRSGGTSGGIVIDVSSVKIYSLASDWTWVFKIQNIAPKKTTRKFKFHGKQYE